MNVETFLHKKCKGLKKEDALNECEKWRREWCNPLINKKFK